MNIEERVGMLEKVITRVGDTSNTTRNELYAVLKKLEKIEAALTEIIADKK